MAMDISEIRNKYYSGGYTFKMDIPKNVWDDHVFDEELSVKRNRELAKEHNAEVARLTKYKKERQIELDKQFTYDVVVYLMAYHSLTEEKARLVESFVYKEWHSCMSDYFCYIDEVGELAFELLRVNMGGN